MGIYDLCGRASDRARTMTPWDIVQMYAVEISLGTYFRRGDELVEKPQWWQMQCVEALTRQLRSDVSLHDWAPIWMRIRGLFCAVKEGRRYVSVVLKKL